MADGVPGLYFRIRDTGAAVFRVDSENRNRRMDMDQIATINLQRDEVKPHGDAVASDDEKREIRNWISRRKTILSMRELDQMYGTVEAMNLLTQWAQTRASAAQLDEITDDLLLAMHDLRAVLVRKKAERLSKD